MALQTEAGAVWRAVDSILKPGARRNKTRERNREKYGNILNGNPRVSKSPHNHVKLCLFSFVWLHIPAKSVQTDLKSASDCSSLWPAHSAGRKDPAASDAHCLLAAQRSASAHLHRLLVCTSVFQPASETQPNGVESIPHSRWIRACLACGGSHICSPEPVSGQGSR